VNKRTLNVENILEALYILNQRAKEIGKSGQIQHKSLSEEREEIYYKYKYPAILHLYGENRIELEGYHSIGLDDKKYLLFQKGSFSFHCSSNEFNTCGKYLGHLAKFPERNKKVVSLTIGEAKILIQDYLEFIEGEICTSD